MPVMARAAKRVRNLVIDWSPASHWRTQLIYCEKFQNKTSLFVHSESRFYEFIDASWAGCPRHFMATWQSIFFYCLKGKKPPFLQPAD